MKDIEVKLDRILDAFHKGQEGDCNANNSGLIALAYAIAHLSDRLVEISDKYKKFFDGV